MLNLMDKLILSLWLVCFSHQAYAWSAPVHRIIAQIAYEHLQPKVRQQVITLNLLFAKNYQQSRRFETSAVWADQIIQRDITAFNHWHYINKPFSPDNSPLPNIAQQNVVWAINQSYQVLASDKPTPFEKAFFLYFLVHLVGDIHQPLHCATRVTQRHPQGDGGGNGYTINATEDKQLHRYWDNALGLYSTYPHRHAHGKQDLVTAWAKDLVARYPINNYQGQLNGLHPEQWANESYQLAIQFVYSLPEGATPSMAYIDQGRAIAEQRIVLAGYRLAALLNNAFANH